MSKWESNQIVNMKTLNLNELKYNREMMSHNIVTVNLSLIYYVSNTFFNAAQPQPLGRF